MILIIIINMIDDPEFREGAAVSMQRRDTPGSGFVDGAGQA